MKKTLVALAALAATAAFAQSTVTMYGVVDIATGTKDIKGNTGVVSSGKQTGIMDGGFAGNRIGFRGTEDLGGGQSVGFVVEQGMSPTNGALFGVRTANSGFQLDGLAASTGRFDQGTGGGYSQGTNRQTYAGFNSGGMGEVRIGYQYTALYEVSTLMGFTQTSEGVYGGSAAHVHGAAVAGGTRANMINYISPRVSGFGLGLQTGSAGGRETTESLTANTATGLTKDVNKRDSIKLDFEQGPWKAAYANTKFTSTQSARVAGTTANTAFPACTTASSPVCTQNSPVITTFNVLGALTSLGASAAAAQDFNTKMNQLAGSYTGSGWKVGFTRNSGTLNQVANAATTAANGGYGAAAAPAASTYNATGTYDFDSQRVTGLYTLGAVDLTYGMGTAKVKNTTSGASVVTLMDLKESQLGAIYNLSKRTKLYAYSGKWTNESAAVNAATTAAAAASAYKGTQTLVGLFHSF